MTLTEYEKDPNHISTNFIKYYYSKLNSDCSKLFQLYTADAVLKHMNYREDPFGASSNDIHGADNIKKYWKSTPSLKGAKIIILTASTIQNTDNSLVISVVGELLFRKDYESVADEILPTKTFTHTFILQPEASRDIFNIKSDILTFIPDADYMNSELTEEEGMDDATKDETSPTNGAHPAVEETLQSGTDKNGEIKTGQSNSQENKPTKPNNTDKPAQQVVVDSPNGGVKASNRPTPSDSTPLQAVATEQPCKVDINEKKESDAASTIPTTTSKTSHADPSLKSSHTKLNSVNGKSSPATGPAQSSTSTSTSPASTAVKATKQKSPTPELLTPPKTATAAEKHEQAKSASAADHIVPITTPNTTAKSTETSSGTASHSSPAPASTVSAATPAASSSWANSLKFTPSLKATTKSSSNTEVSNGTAAAGSSKTTQSAPASNGNGQSKQLFEIYVNFKNTAIPVDEDDLMLAFAKNNFKKITVVSLSKNNTAVVGFHTQDEQTRALEKGKIFYKGTQFGLDKREKKQPNKRKNNYNNTNAYKNNDRKN